MAADTYHVNTNNHTFTIDPPGTPILMRHCQNMEEQDGTEVVVGSGCGDFRPSVIAVVFQNPTWVGSFMDQLGMADLPIGAVGTLAYTVMGAHLKDAVSGGGFTVEVDRAVIIRNGLTNPHRQLATNEVAWQAETLDGFTNPKTMTPL